MVRLNEAAAAVSGRAAGDLHDRLGSFAPQSLSKAFTASYGLSDRADPQVSIVEPNGDRSGRRSLRTEPALCQSPREARVPEAVAKRPPEERQRRGRMRSEGRRRVESPEARRLSLLSRCPRSGANVGLRAAGGDR
jgi:hypothetical protein